MFECFVTGENQSLAVVLIQMIPWYLTQVQADKAAGGRGGVLSKLDGTWKLVYSSNRCISACRNTPRDAMQVLFTCNQRGRGGSGACEGTWR